MSDTTKDLVNEESKELMDFSDYSGDQTGFEDTSSESFKTPFLKILQMLSPELKKNDPKHIPEAEAGMYCNTATQEIYDALKVIVLKVSHSLVVWLPNRGGFVGRYPLTEEDNIVAHKEGLHKWDQDGNEVVDTMEFFLVNANNPSDMFIFPVSAASFKHARSFATRLRMLKKDGKPVNVAWAGVWSITTAEESNDKGSWYTLGVTPKFERFITREEKQNVIDPTLEMFKTATVDYSSTVENTDAEEDMETEF